MNVPRWLVPSSIALLLAACATSTPPVAGPTFSNTTAIVIPDGDGTFGPAAPYPSTILVTGLPTDLESVTVRLTNLSHTWPDDLAVLLVGPGGQHTLLMSRAGGAANAVGVDLIFDAAAATAIADSGPLVSGRFRPAAYGVEPVLPPGAPAGPYVADLSVFDGTDPNGTWSLYVYDAVAQDVGTISGGWSLIFPAD